METATAPSQGRPDVPDRQTKQLRFVEENVVTQYAGIFNISLGADEAVFIFGNPSIDPNIIRIESKTAVSLKTAKRFALSLAGLIKRYEKKKRLSILQNTAGNGVQDRIR